MNETLAYTGLKIETNTEYTPDSLEIILSRYEIFCHIDENTFVHGRGHRKSQEQRYDDRLKYIEKLSKYVEKILKEEKAHVCWGKGKYTLLIAFFLHVLKNKEGLKKQS